MVLEKEPTDFFKKTNEAIDLSSMVLTSLFKCMHRFLDVLIIGTDLE
jgi:hypothetical protein